jgi:hypothetical protein
MVDQSKTVHEGERATGQPRAELRPAKLRRWRMFDEGETRTGRQDGVKDQEQEQEARIALERVRRDSETVGASSMARLGRRMGDHFGGKDAVGPDGAVDLVEVWGRRIGRSLSVVAFVLLSLWLASQLGYL